MYCPNHFVESDLRILQALVETHNFATLISTVEGRPFATHLPFFGDLARRRLYGHMARANPHWQALVADHADALIVFAGPHAYISPSWYASPGVPTWNYATVHVYGALSVIEDPQEHEQVMSTLTARHEGQRSDPWKADFGAPLINGMLGATVAFRIDISEIQGKFKLSQNRPAQDRTNVIRELTDSVHDGERGVAELMRERQ
jgi:transcriptional regulator